MRHHQTFTGNRHRAATYLTTDLKNWTLAEAKRHGITESQLIAKILETAMLHSSKDAIK